MSTDATDDKSEARHIQKNTIPGLESTGYIALLSPPRLMRNCGVQSWVDTHTHMPSTTIPSPLAKRRRSN